MLVHEDSSQNPKLEKIITKIVTGLGIYCIFLNPVQEFSSCPAQNGSLLARF